MANTNPPPRKAPSAPTTPAIVVLHPTKNCLLNLPGSLVSVLVGSNTPAQNVIVELSWKATSQTTGLTTTRSAFTGWTGMQSKRRTAAPSNARGGTMREEAAIEIDPAYARTVGLTEGNKINISIHIDPPTSHTVHIEPLTPSDWEIIELHASYLELNLLAQIRALTLSHPLTIYLSHTSTASIKVTKVEPENSLITSAHSPAQFSKLSPDAEVIVAPKSRQRRQSKPVAPPKSNTSTVGKPRKKAEAGTGEGGGMFFRGISLPTEDTQEEDEDIKAGGKGCVVYVDPEVLATPPLRLAGYVNVTIVRPPGLAPPQDPQQAPPAQDQDAPNPDLAPATRIIAKLMPWENAPDMKHIALSRVTANALDIGGRVGTMIRIEPACPQLAKNINIKVKIHPFSKPPPGDSQIVKWGSKHKSLEKEEGARRLIQVLGKRERKRDLAVITAPGVSGSGSNIGISPPEQPSPGEGFLEGPITDGLILPAIPDCPLWAGGLIKLEMSPSPDHPNSSKFINWFLPTERKYTLELSTETNRHPVSGTLKYENHLLVPSPATSTPIVGVDGIIDTIVGNLISSSSVLLAGPHLSGKSSILNLIANRLRKGPYYYQVINPGPMSKFAEERVPVIKDEFTRWFMMARFAASLSTGGETGGYGGAVIILDDLERVCKAENAEPGAVSDSGRARQVAEVIVGIMRRFCTDGTGMGSGIGGGNVVVLGACSGKENVHAWMVGGRGFREVVNLKGPNRDGRRRILEGVVSALYGNKKAQDTTAPPASSSSGTELIKRAPPPEKELDLLEIAGQTDGYMPGDLVLLVGRARHEAVVRVVDECKDDYSSLPNTSFELELKRSDFDNALKGFVPVGLRGVKLQTSGVNWKDIGGLRETRQTLLETLEWPTKYAPIFANCPLRLRSGLLLYGYPGCGKTLLASAVAGECGLNFISVKGPEILNKYIGASEKSVRDLFERASSAKPCVLFFDEFDSIAPKRGHDSTGVTDRVVNQMLTQMDGAEGLDGVYVLAATSRPDLIDPALLRPGRLDKSLLCDLPDKSDRLDILHALSEKLEVGSEVDLGEIAERTEGYSGADLQAVLYNAHLEAIHDVIDEEERRVEGSEGNSDDPHSTSSPSSKRKSEAAGGGAGQDDTGMGDHEFFQFVFGDAKGGLQMGPNGHPIPIPIPTQHPSNTKPIAAESRSKRLAERASMLAKLDLLKKRSRPHPPSSPSSSTHPHPPTNSPSPDDLPASPHNEVIIRPTHLERSLATTRSSISPEERRRLKTIYREFIGSRNGEMKSGEGSMEVGGRSSLM